MLTIFAGYFCLKGNKSCLSYSTTCQFRTHRRAASEQPAASGAGVCGGRRAQSQSQSQSQSWALARVGGTFASRARVSMAKTPRNSGSRWPNWHFSVILALNRVYPGFACPGSRWVGCRLLLAAPLLAACSPDRARSRLLDRCWLYRFTPSQQNVSA